MLGSQPNVKTVEIDFLIMSTHNGAYNVILGWPSLNKIKAIVLTPHLLMKFPTNHVVGQVRVNQQIAKHYYMASLTKNQGIEQSKANLQKMNAKPSKMCQIIDSVLLDVKGDDKHQL